MLIFLKHFLKFLTINKLVDTFTKIGLLFLFFSNIQIFLVF